MALPWLLVLLPWAGALLLAALPPRGRLPAMLNIAVSAGGCAAALALLGQPPAVLGWLRLDALNGPLVAVAGIVGLTAAGFSAATVAAEGLHGFRARAYHAGFQLFMGAQFLALLADNLGLLWVAIELATLASVVIVAIHGTPAAIEAAWKFFLLCGVGIALALFGTILLYLAATPLLGAGGLSFAALLGVAARCDPAILSLAFVFLMVGYGTKAGLVPLHAWLPDAEAEGPLPITAILAGLLLNAAMLALWRMTSIVALHPGALPAGTLLLGFGLASVLLAALALWRRRDVRRLFAWSSIEHMGLAAIAFGLGGPLGTAAGLVHLLGHTLVKSAVFFAVGAAAQIKSSQRIAAIGGLAASHPALGWGLALGIAGLAGMPPFALFATEWRILGMTATQTPWLLLPLAVGLLTAAAGLIAVLHRLCLGAPTPDCLGAPARDCLGAPVRDCLGAPARDDPDPGAFGLPGGTLWASIPVWLHLALAAALTLWAPTLLPTLLGGLAG